MGERARICLSPARAGVNEAETQRISGRNKRCMRPEGWGWLASLSREMNGRLRRGTRFQATGPILKVLHTSRQRHYSKHTLMDTSLKPHSPRRPGVLLSDDTPVNNSPGPGLHSDDARGRKIVIPAAAAHKTALRVRCFPAPENLSRLIVRRRPPP